jgi:hypothetical protein
MANKIYARKAVVFESLDARHSAARERVRMNALLVDRLEQKSRKLDDVIQIKLARFNFVSIFRGADDQTKQEMLHILLVHGRDWRRGMAKVKAFLKKNGTGQS